MHASWARVKTRSGYDLATMVNGEWDFRLSGAQPRSFGDVKKRWER